MAIQVTALAKTSLVHTFEFDTSLERTYYYVVLTAQLFELHNNCTLPIRVHVKFKLM